MSALLDQVTLYGPCPGCGDWQVDVSESAARSYPVPEWIQKEARRRVEEESARGSYRLADVHVWAIVRARDDLLEGVLREHAEECPELGRLLDGLHLPGPRA